MTDSSPPAPDAAVSDPAPLLDMLDLETGPDEAEPDVTVERDGVVVTGTDATAGPHGDGGIGHDNDNDNDNEDGTETDTETEPAVSADLDWLCTIAVSVLLGEDVTRGRLDVHLVSDDVIADLNIEHLGGEGPTDVLSFPLNPDDFVAPAMTADAPPLLGDIVLCPSVAVAQAPAHAGSVDAEFALLVVHGVLHILGHDHAEPEQTELMQERERIHLERLGFAHPVLAQ